MTKTSTSHHRSQCKTWKVEKFATRTELKMKGKRQTDERNLRIRVACATKRNRHPCVVGIGIRVFQHATHSTWRAMWIASFPRSCTRYMMRDGQYVTDNVDMNGDNNKISTTRSQFVLIPHDCHTRNSHLSETNSKFESMEENNKQQ